MWLITYEQEKTEINKSKTLIKIYREKITCISNRNPIRFWFELLDFAEEENKSSEKRKSFKYIILYSYKFDYDESEFSKTDLEKIDCHIENVILIEEKEEEILNSY